MIVVHRLGVLLVFGGGDVVRCVPRWLCGVPIRVDVGRFIGRVLWVFGGVFLLQSLAGGQCFIGSVCVSMSGRYGGNMAMWLGASLLQSLAGGQWFIGSVCVSMSVRYGGNMAMWFGVSLRPCVYSLQVIKR